MGAQIDRLGAVLLDGAVAALILLGASALAMVLCGQPSRRLTLGRTALIGALALLPLAILAPVPRFFVRPSLASLMPPGAASLVAREWPWPLTWWRRAVAGLAAVGMMVGLIGTVLGALAGRRLMGRTIEAAPETIALYDALTASRRRRPRLRVSARVRRPVLVGAFRPTILLPPDLDEPGQEAALRLGLLHELVHYERRDPAFGLAALLAGSLWFFVPPIWWICRQIRMDQEFLADRRASERFGPGTAYAASLVGMAEGGTGEASGARSAGAEPRGMSALFQRVLMLIRCPFPVEARAPAWWVALCVATLGCGAVLASGLTLGDDPSSALVLDPRPNRPTHGVLQIARLTLDAREPGTDGLAPPYTLLQALPGRFEMVVQVRADPDEFPNMAIAGRRLGPLPPRPGASPLLDGFHKVRLVRDASGLRLWVAGRLVPPNPLDAEIPDLLSLQPAPGAPGRYQNLVLTW